MIKSGMFNDDTRVIDHFPLDVCVELASMAKGDPVFNAAHDALRSACAKHADEPIGLRTYIAAEAVLDALRCRPQFRAPTTLVDLKKQHWWSHLLFDEANAPILAQNGKPLALDEYLGLEHRYDRDTRFKELASNAQAYAAATPKAAQHWRKFFGDKQEQLVPLIEAERAYNTHAAWCTYLTEGNPLGTYVVDFPIAHTMDPEDMVRMLHDASDAFLSREQHRNRDSFPDVSIVVSAYKKPFAALQTYIGNQLFKVAQNVTRETSTVYANLVEEFISLSRRYSRVLDEDDASVREQYGRFDAALHASTSQRLAPMEQIRIHRYLTK